MSDGRIRYNSVGIDAGFANLNTFVSNLDERLEELETSAAVIVASWESDQARAAYDERMLKWRAAATTIKEAVTNVAGKLASSSEEMTLVDNMSARYF